jgi:hypothetical protein
MHGMLLILIISMLAGIHAFTVRPSITRYSSLKTRELTFSRQAGSDETFSDAIEPVKDEGIESVIDEAATDLEMATGANVLFPTGFDVKDPQVAFSTTTSNSPFHYQISLQILLPSTIE